MEAPLVGPQVPAQGSVSLPLGITAEKNQTMELTTEPDCAEFRSQLLIQW